MDSPRYSKAHAHPLGDAAGKLLLFAREVVDGLSAGLHRSPHKGSSVAFKQHRQYVPGDELRRMDWKAFARLDRFYLREYEQETNLQAMLVVDVSGSMEYCGSAATASKADYARRLAAAVGMLLLQQHDSVGLATLDSALRGFVPPRSTPSHLQLLANTLASAGAGADTRLAAALRELTPRLPARSLLVLFSDCLDQLPDFFQSLALLRHRHHEIILFHIFDRDERDFPFERWTRFESLEHPGAFESCDAAALRRIYLENLASFQSELVQGCRKHRIDLIPVVTDEPCIAALHRCLSARQKNPRGASPRP